MQSLLQVVFHHFGAQWKNPLLVPQFITKDLVYPASAGFWGSDGLGLNNYPSAFPSGQVDLKLHQL